MMTRPAVIAAASCVIGNRHPLVKSDTSTSMMKDQTEDGSRGANMFVWIATLLMKSPVVKNPCFCDWQFDTEESLNDAMSDVLRRRAGQ